MTICDLLEQSGAQVLIFDMGRRVIEIPLEVMRRFELNEIAYPQPFLRSAWLGILFYYPEGKNEAGKSTKDGITHNIWFIKFPLDERGLLLLATRDDFLHHILESITETKGTDFKNQTMDNNPYGFTPREDKMAIFHAKISHQLYKPPSQYYAHARDYFSGKTGFDQWQFVGLQGIADVTVRLEDDNNAQILASSFAHLPTTPLVVLCSCLENKEIDETLTGEIARRISTALGNGDATVVAAGLRGLSYSRDLHTVNTTLHAVLSNPAGQNVEVLAAIAARCWYILEDNELRLLFLESLASCDAGQKAFNNILADLLYMPDLRQLILDDFSHSNCSRQLARAIDTFLASVPKTSIS